MHKIVNPPNRRRRSGRRRSIAILSALVLLLGGALVASGPAVSGTTPPFAIDGVVPDAGADQLEDPEGNVKELGPLNSNTTKIGVIHADAIPTLGLTNPNANVDLRRAWLDTAKDASGDNWLYFAWERDSNSGSGFIAYEFMHAPAPADCDYLADPTTLINSCNPWANRRGDIDADGNAQDPDFIILWDQQGGSTDLYLRKWTGQAPNLTLGAAEPLNASVSAAAYSTDKFRGEAAINLTDAIFGGTDGCQTFANAIPSTVTGNSDTADYKDTVLQQIEPITNCGTLVIQKKTVNGVGDFSFTSNVPSNTSFGLTTTVAGDAGIQSRTMTGVHAGTYSVSETSATNWTTTSSCSNGNPVTAIQVTAGTTVTCLFVNTLQVGSVHITKTDDASPAAALAGATFTLYKDVAPLGGTRGVEDTTVGGSCTTAATTGVCDIANVVAGAYWAVETTTPAGYTTAANQLITVTAGQTLNISFVDPRQFTVITVVCKDSGHSLYPSTVVLDGSSKTSIATGDTGAATAAQLCTTSGLGGATFSPKAKGAHTGSVTIP